MSSKKIPLSHHKKKYKNINFSLIIVSDTRSQQFQTGDTPQDLTSPLVGKILLKSNYILQNKFIVPDDKDEILQILSSLIDKSDIDIILTSGGTGISPRDQTLETIQPLFDKEIMGFGEIFRYMSFEEIGSAAMLSRATAGIIKSKIIFVLPGNPNAVELALNKLIIPEIDHMLNMIGK
ncbi:MAG: molybdenum cofactor biosynthesis protein MoaB [Candidatus Helarchaeota archaeon]|nr:molybdenum cofactor biosynthesis protein MoaB [Candidatus Helarchaeota archaeon]